MKLGVLEIHWDDVCEDRVEVGGNCLQNVMFKRRELRQEDRKENCRLQSRSEKA